MKSILGIGVCCFLLSVFSLMVGSLLFPGSFLQAWFEPWKSTYAQGERLGIAHKPVADDVFRQIYPMKQLAADMIGRGQLPLWNPYNGAGQPLLATMHPGFLNPFSFFLTLFPGYGGWTLFLFGQVGLLISGMYTYTRTLRMSKFGSLVSVVILVFSGIVTSRLVYGDYVYALATLPWLLGAVEKKRFWIVPVSVTFLFFCVQPQIVLYILGFFYLYSWIRVSIWRDKLLILVGSLVGIGMAGMQLLPTLELYRLANVTPSSSDFIFDRFLLPITQLISIVFPNYFGNAGTYNYWGAGDFVETIGSIGLLATFLALVAVMKGKFSGVMKLSVWTVVVCVVLVLDSPFTRFIYGLGIPILSTGIPSRIFLLSTFVLAILAGKGADIWQKAGYSIKFVTKPLLVVGSIVGLVGVYSLYQVFTNGICPTQILQCRMVALRNYGVEVVVFLSFVVGVIGLFLFKKRLLSVPTTPLVSSMLSVTIVGLGVFTSAKFLPFSPVSSFYPSVPLLSFLATKSDGRVMGVGSAAVSPNLATQLRLFDPNYYDPLYVRRYGELVSYTNTGSLSEGLTRSDVQIVAEATPSALVAVRRERLWDMLNVTYIIEKKSELPSPLFGTPLWEDEVFRVVERAKALPFAWMVHEAEVALGEDSVSRLFAADFDPKNTLVLEEPIQLNGNGRKAEKTALTIESRLPQEIRFIAEATQAGYLVLSQTHYPGWKATVQGKEVPVLRVNYALTAVPLSPGVSTVQLVYKPESLKWGIVVTLTSIGVFLVYIARTYRQSLVSSG